MSEVRNEGMGLKMKGVLATWGHRVKSHVWLGGLCVDTCFLLGGLCGVSVRSQTSAWQYPTGLAVMALGGPVLGKERTQVSGVLFIAHLRHLLLFGGQVREGRSSGVPGRSASSDCREGTSPSLIQQLMLRWPFSFMPSAGNL